MPKARGKPASLPAGQPKAQTQSARKRPVIHSDPDDEDVDHNKRIRLSDPRASDEISDEASDEPSQQAGRQASQQASNDPESISSSDSSDDDSSSENDDGDVKSSSSEEDSSDNDDERDDDVVTGGSIEMNKMQQLMASVQTEDPSLPIPKKELKLLFRFDSKIQGTATAFEALFTEDNQKNGVAYVLVLARSTRLEADNAVADDGTELYTKEDFEITLHAIEKHPDLIRKQSIQGKKHSAKFIAEKLEEIIKARSSHPKASMRNDVTKEKADKPKVGRGDVPVAFQAAAVQNSAIGNVQKQPSKHEDNGSSTNRFTQFSTNTPVLGTKGKQLEHVELQKPSVSSDAGPSRSGLVQSRPSTPALGTKGKKPQKLEFQKPSGSGNVGSTINKPDRSSSITSVSSMKGNMSKQTEVSKLPASGNAGPSSRKVVQFSPDVPAPGPKGKKSIKSVPQMASAFKDPIEPHNKEQGNLVKVAGTTHLPSQPRQDDDRETLPRNKKASNLQDQGNVSHDRPEWCEAVIGGAAPSSAFMSHFLKTLSIKGATCVTHGIIISADNMETSEEALISFSQLLHPTNSTELAQVVLFDRSWTVIHVDIEAGSASHFCSSVTVTESEFVNNFANQALRRFSRVNGDVLATNVTCAECDDSDSGLSALLNTACLVNGRKPCADQQSLDFTACRVLFPLLLHKGDYKTAFDTYMGSQLPANAAGGDISIFKRRLVEGEQAIDMADAMTRQFKFVVDMMMQLNESFTEAQKKQIEDISGLMQRNAALGKRPPEQDEHGEIGSRGQASNLREQHIALASTHTFFVTRLQPLVEQLGVKAREHLEDVLGSMTAVAGTGERGDKERQLGQQQAEAAKLDQAIDKLRQELAKLSQERQELQEQMEDTEAELDQQSAEEKELDRLVQQCQRKISSAIA